MSNVHGLGSTKKARDKNDDGNEMFSQDGSVSGTGVLRPIKRTGDTTADIIAAANEQARSGQQQGGDHQGVVKIYMYKNGFKVGEDGEFRSSADPRNKKFLQEMDQGVVPSELEQQFAQQGAQGGGSVRVDIVDNSKDNYEPPKPKFQAFTGTGFSMGGSNKPVGLSFKNATPQEVKINDNEDSTTIQIVTHQRKRHRVKFNVSQTVMHVYQHVMTLVPDLDSFDLLAGFPPKVLSDPNATILEAKLKGESITVKK